MDKMCRNAVMTQLRAAISVMEELGRKVPMVQCSPYGHLTLDTQALGMASKQAKNAMKAALDFVGEQP